MFIRVKLSPNGNEKNIMVHAIASFEPQTDGTGSFISVVGDTDYSVEESCRTLRHMIKKASASTSTED